MPTNAASPRVVIDLPKRIAVGVATDFSVTFYPGNQAGTMVVGEGFLPEGDYKAQYYEVQDGTWKDFPQGSNQFGPSSGFPLQEATSYFRVTFNSDFLGTFTVKMKRVSDDEYLAQDSVSVVAATGETIDELNQRIANANGGTVSLETDVEGTVLIGNNVVLDGRGHTLHGNIVLTATGDSLAYDVVVQSLVMREDGKATSAKGYGIYGQNQTADQTVKPVRLTVRDCNIQSYAKKGVYLTNAKRFNMSACTIGNVATEPMNSPNTYGDYAIDLNLCGVRDASVSIVGNTFTGSCGAIGAVKVTQRGGVGLTDDVNTDIKNPVSASITSCSISGNDFSAMNLSRSEGVANVVLGSSPNSDGTARTYNNSYPSLIGSMGETYVNVRGTSAADMTFTMEDGSSLETYGVLTSAGTYDMVLDASAGVTLTGTLRDGASFAEALDWEIRDGGACGIGFLGYRRLCINRDTLSYPAGGIAIPVPFAPQGVIVNVKGGAEAWFDSSSSRIVLYRQGAEIAGGTALENITIVMIGY